MADALVLAAGALPILGGTEDTLAEQAVFFRLERAVVDGLGLLHLTAAPLTDAFGRSQRDLDGVKLQFFGFHIARRKQFSGHESLLFRSRRPSLPGPNPGRVKVRGVLKYGS